LTAPARMVEPTPASPQSYTPRHLAEKILASRDALHGERKQVTVLFADVVESTELIQGRDPEEAQHLLDGVVQVMMDAVHRYEGTVSRLMGDGLMAMFGAPVAHEDHAVRACYAALAMLDGVRRHGEAARRAHGITPTIRVGLSAGEVVVRTIRDDLHMDYTAMGQTVHLASRMEQLARPDTTALTPDTLALVEGYVQVRSLGPVAIKGLPEPMEAFELLRAGTARTRLQVAAARGLTRFVGRDAEVAALYAALARAGSGQGQVAALVGEPGVGKSRLVWELTHSHRTEGWLVLESGSVSYGKATSYLPVIDLLKGYCRIEARDDPRTVREKVTGKLLTLDRALEPTLPALLALLDVSTGDLAWDALDPSQRRRRTLDALKRLLIRESREQPLLLVFEDLHWIDAETQALLDSLVESFPTARILMLVNYRPEYSHGWGGRTFYTQLRVDPLGQESADELLAALLGNDSSLAALKNVLVGRTEGNPFFLEESVRSLVETGLLVGERGAYRLSRPVGDVRVPATVQAVLASRIDRLPSDAKRLLQTAAVIGKDVPDALLRAVADHDDSGLQRELAVLRAAEFLYETSLFPEPEYTFKHALTHEVAYGSLLQDRKRDLHARIAEAIERLSPDRLAEHVERLAYHALRGEAWERAVVFYRQVGEKAMGRLDDREGQAAIGQALVALNHLPESRETLEQGIDLRLALRRAAPDVQQMRDAIREAERLAVKLGDRRQLARVWSARAATARLLGDLDEALEAGRRAVLAADSLADPLLRLTTGSVLAGVHHSRGEFRLAIDNLAHRISLVREDVIQGGVNTVSLAVEVRSRLAWSLCEIGAFAEANAHLAEAVRIAETLDHTPSLINCANHLSWSSLRGGYPEKTIFWLERNRTLSEGKDASFISNWTAAGLGIAYALVGRIDDGVALLEQAIAANSAMQMTEGHSVWLGWLAEAYLLAARFDEAADAATRALNLADGRGERGFGVYAIRALAEIAARRDPPDVEAAERWYEEALARTERLEMRALQARCRLVLGMLYRRTGRADEARHELTTAVGLLRDMDMAYWLPEAEEELAQAGGPVLGEKAG
jgi:class 3 adenylate cyclase/tetratricopeptide (TPR) repeat protein